MGAPHKKIGKYDCGCGACYKHRTNAVIYGELHRTVVSPHNHNTRILGTFRSRRAVSWWQNTPGVRALEYVPLESSILVIPVREGEFVPHKERSSAVPYWIWDQQLAWGWCRAPVECLSPMGLVCMLPGDLVFES